MSHMVLYSGRDGVVAFTRCNELSEAIVQVERLRNEDNVDQVQIFRLEEVKFEMKPYYRVEIPQAAVFDTIVSEPLTYESVATELAAPAPAMDEPVDAPAPPQPTRTEVPAMVTPPPPPPPPPAPAAPMTYAGSAAEDSDASIGSRRGLFGR